MNNDRFKFRVWNINLKMYIEKRNDIILTHYGDFEDCDYCERQSEVTAEYNIFEQCTGLRDKNGKLIYEGDVVRCTHTYYGTTLQCLAVVRWDKCNPCFVLQNKENKDYIENDFSNCGLIEIVGNIHEVKE